MLGLGPCESYILGLVGHIWTQEPKRILPEWSLGISNRLGFFFCWSLKITSGLFGLVHLGSQVGWFLFTLKKPHVCFGLHWICKQSLNISLRIIILSLLINWCNGFKLLISILRQRKKINFHHDCNEYYGFYFFLYFVYEM